MAINPYRKGGPDVPVNDGGTEASDASGARANLGAGDLTAAGHATINHTGLPGVPGGLQTRFFTMTWTNSSTAFSTGVLAFTPSFAIVYGIATHDNAGLPTATWTGQLASVFFGVAKGPNSNDSGVVTAQQHNSGNANDQAAAFDNGFVGGNPPAGDVIGNAVTLSLSRRLDVTSWGSGGITLTPNSAFTARAFMLVVGE